MSHFKSKGGEYSEKKADPLSGGMSLGGKQLEERKLDLAYGSSRKEPE
jgi:hypothetical protein